MFNSKDSPLEWAQSMSELEDTHAHLGDLTKCMADAGCIDMEGYSIDIAHVYAHMKRAWNSRKFEGDMSEAQWEEYRAFPTDIEPLAQ